MRLCLVLCLAGCAPKPMQQPQPSPAPAALRPEEVRACESCRQNLEICRRVRIARNDSQLAPCVDELMLCLQAQNLDSIRCAGLN